MLLQINEPGSAPEAPAPKAPAIGIDFGTTNSVAAVVADDKTLQFIEDNHGNRLHPSVAIYNSSGLTGVAHSAAASADSAPIRSVKRLLGSGITTSDRSSFPLTDVASDGLARLALPCGDRSAIEVAADILTYLRTLASTQLAQDIRQAVITVPAYFDDASRQAVRDAARLAGLEVLRLVSEPTAAALAYGLDSGSEGVYAVYDLGGGTFDVSILRLEKGVFQVLAVGGDAALGGDDFDALLADSFLHQVSYDAPLTPADRQRLLLAARTAREKLTQQPLADMTLWLPDRDCSHRFTTEDAAALFKPLIARTLAACQGALLDAGINNNALDGVVLVGGTTRMPAVRQALETFFGRPPLADIDPDSVVATGAARQAAALNGGDGTLLLDVVPLSLGLETMGGLVEKVIDRNSPIPCARAQEFTTYQDGQTGMVIHVLQGERETVQHCRSLARFTLSGIPPLPAGAAKIEVMFTVDADGLLTVAAKEQHTGISQRIDVKPTYGLREEEMAAMLHASYANAQQDMQQRLLTEAQVEARQMLTALDKTLASDGNLLSADERQSVVNARDYLQETVGKNVREPINSAMEALEKAAAPLIERRVNKALHDALAGKAVEQVGEG